jgi:hypothetical protein
MHPARVSPGGRWDADVLVVGEPLTKPNVSGFYTAPETLASQQLSTVFVGKYFSVSPGGGGIQPGGSVSGGRFAWAPLPPA